MVVRIWGVIRLVEQRSERAGNLFPALNSHVCVGQAQGTARHQIVNSRLLEETRRMGADVDLRASVFAGNEKAMTAAMMAAIAVCQGELTASFRELKHNIDAMQAFTADLGHETAVHPKIVLTGPDGDRWEVATEDELQWAAPQFLNSKRVVSWLREEFERFDPAGASGR